MWSFERFSICIQERIMRLHAEKQKQREVQQLEQQEQERLHRQEQAQKEADERARQEHEKAIAASIAAAGN
jgi:hypothetical protein